MSMRIKAAALLALALAGGPMAALAGGASAPEPTKPVPPAFFSGRWYEIARLPTKSQKDCEGGVSQFTGGAAGADFNLVQTCHIGALDGPLKTFDTTGKILDGAANAKFVAVMVNNLSPATDHCVRVRVRTVLGWSTWSEVSATFRTLAAPC